MNKFTLAVLMFIFSGVASAITPDNSAYKDNFEKNYTLVSIANTEAQFKDKSTNVNITVNEGGTLTYPLDKHSKAIYTIKSINIDTVKIHYKSTFDASSFGGKISETSGDFIVTAN